MRDLKFRGIEKLSEEERRKKYSKKISMTSVVFFGIFLIILILGIAFTEGRVCLDQNQTLSSGACVGCEDIFCENCANAGPSGCDKCKTGY